MSSSPRESEDFSPKNIDNLLNKMDAKVGRPKETKEFPGYTLDQLLANNGSQFVDIIKNRQNYPTNQPLDAIKIVNTAMVNSTQRDVILNSSEKRASLKAFIQILGEEYSSKNNRLSLGEVAASKDFTSWVYSTKYTIDQKKAVFDSSILNTLQLCCIKDLQDSREQQRSLMGGFFSVEYVYEMQKLLSGSIQMNTVNSFIDAFYSSSPRTNYDHLIKTLRFFGPTSGSLSPVNIDRILKLNFADQNTYGSISVAIRKAVEDLGSGLMEYVHSQDRQGMILLFKTLRYAGINNETSEEIFKIYIDKVLDFGASESFLSEILLYIHSSSIELKEFDLLKINFLDAIRNKSIAYIEQAKTSSNLDPVGLSGALSFVTLLAPKYNYDVDLSFLGVSKELLKKRKESICTPTWNYGEVGFYDPADPFTKSKEYLASMQHKTNSISDYFEHIIKLVNTHGKESIQKIHDTYNIEIFDRYDFNFLDHMYRNIEKPTGKPMMWIFANKRDHNGAFNGFPDETDLLDTYDVRIFEPGDDNNKFFKEKLKNFSDGLGGLEGGVPFIRIGMHGDTNIMVKRAEENKEKATQDVIDYGAADRIWASDPAFWEGIQPYVYGGKLFIDACSTAGHTATGEGYVDGVLRGAIAEMAATYCGIKETYAPANNTPTGSFVTINGQVLYKFVGTTVQYNAGDNLPVPNGNQVNIQLQEKYDLSQSTNNTESFEIKNDKNRLFLHDSGKKYGIGLINATTGTYGVFWEGLSDNVLEFTLNGSEILLTKNDLEKGEKLVIPYYLVGADSNINTLQYSDNNNGVVDKVDYNLVNHTYKPHILSYINVEGSYTERTEKQKAAACRAFPNPTTGKITFEFFNDKLINEDINITSMSGSIVRKIKAEKKNMSIDMSTLADGTYFVGIGKTGAKIILQK